jgi:hypothetical protein
MCWTEIIPFEPDAVSSVVGKSSNLISGFHGRLSFIFFNEKLYINKTHSE